MKYIVIPALAFLFFLTSGCTTPQSNSQMVEETLLTYIIGKTTFEEFKSDSTLRIIQEDIPSTGYLDSTPLQTSITRLETAPTSPWKIYESSTRIHIKNGYRTESHDYVAGNKKEPLAILTFDGDGILQTLNMIE